MHYQLYLATHDTYHLHRFLTNLTASLAAIMSPGGNGMCHCAHAHPVLLVEHG